MKKLIQKTCCHEFAAIGRRGILRTGLTLVELLVSVSVLVIAFLGLYMVMFSSIQLGDLSHELNVATFDMDAVIGHIRRQPLESLLDPDYIDSLGGPRVPHGGIVDPELYRQAGDPPGGQPHLPNEEIIVYYEDESGATLPLPGDATDPVGTHNLTLPFNTPDPLRFVVECSWTSTLGETHTERITAIRTQ